MSDTNAQSPTLVAAAFDRWRSGDGDFFGLIHAAMWDMIASLDLVAQLHRISCPTLILVGENDPSSPPEAARVMHENIVKAQMHVIPDASHMAPLEKPHVINDYIGEFLQSR